MEKQNRLLLVQALRLDTTYFYIFSGLRDYRNLLLKTNPEMVEWLPERMFDFDPLLPNRLTMDFWTHGVSTPGNFIATNINTPTKVLNGFVSEKKLINVLSRAKKQGHPFTHVGFSINVNAFSTFVKCVNAVREFDKNIVIIAGNVGSMFEDTKKYADYICRGNGVPFLRKLFGEDIDTPYQLELMPSKLTTRVFGLTMKSDTAHLVTKLGCPMKCDFCITNQLFQGKFTPSFYTPKQVYEAMVNHREKIKKNFDTLVCEPTAITNKKWWYDLFELFERESDDYTISFATTVASLKKLDYDKISKSSLRIKYVNIGVESFSLDYAKNQKHAETKELIKKLTNYGIVSWATFIIGFDHQTHDSIWDEIHKLIDLDATYYAVLNLKVLPETPLWRRYEAEGRLLNVSNDFYYLDGFQAFKHPHFKPGFEDMLPLLYDINKYIESETGFRGLRMIELYNNIPKQRESFKKEISQIKSLAKLLYPSWKEHLNPNERQIKNYLDKMGKVHEIPEYLSNAALTFTYNK
jgi:radical SAM superfamily enzyme YgiQ (UPF0313 family)